MPLASDKTDARRLRARPGESPPLAARGSAPSPSPTPGTRPAWAPLVVPPRRIAGEMPGYPKEARRLALSGSVLLDMLVTESGQARQIRVLESAGALLDETVVEAVSSWRFEPATRGSVKVPARWRYRHTFNPR